MTRGKRQRADGASWQAELDDCASDDGQIPLIRAAALIRKARQSGELQTRRGLIGALSFGKVQARCSKGWSAAVTSESFQELELDEVHAITAECWSFEHSNNYEVKNGELPSSDTFDWNTGRMRIYRQLTYGGLPACFENLKNSVNWTWPVNWEADLSGITISKADCTRIAASDQFQNWARRLVDREARRRGPTPKSDWDRMKAGLVVAALLDPDRLKASLQTQAGVIALIREECFRLSLNEPSGRDQQNFANALIHEWKMHLPLAAD